MKLAVGQKPQFRTSTKVCREIGHDLTPVAPPQFQVVWGKGNNEKKGEVLKRCCRHPCECTKWESVDLKDVEKAASEGAIVVDHTHKSDETRNTQERITSFSKIFVPSR